MKYKAVAVDQTYHWIDSMQKVAGKIFQVCIFNSEQITNCCEITPSYYLIPIYSYCENEVSESFKDEIHNNDTYEPFYMHVSDVEKLELKDAGDFAIEEEAIEYNKCNVPM